MPLTVGSRLGRYEIVAPLGAGGMGEVYRARDATLGRSVAIKVLPPSYAASPEYRERFAREARAISAVDHPNVCALYDVGSDAGIDYLVLQLVEGETLAQRLRRGPLAVSEVLAVARQIAAGLEAAHDRGVLHRDLKPANVTLTAAGEVKILDFGLAQLRRPDPGEEGATRTMPMTEPGTLLGTVDYMSPEQVRGQPLDRRTDVWSFGCIVFEMLCGHGPFAAPSPADVMAAILRRDPDWGVLPRDTPAGIRRLMRRCLARDLVARLRDIGDARLELDAPDGDETLPAARSTLPVSRVTTMVPWIIATLALVALAGDVWLRGRTGAGAGGGAAMRFSAITNLSGVEAQPALSPDGRSVAFVSNQGGQWDIYVCLVSGGPLIRITNDRNVESWPRWSPDGTQLLYTRLNESGLTDVWVVSALGGPARRLIPNALSGAWSPDGRHIAYSSGNAIWICDANGANPRAVTVSEAPVIHYQPAFSHDGRSIAFVKRRAGPYGEIFVADVETGRTRALTHDGALAQSPDWSADDRSIYFSSSRAGTINIWKQPVAGGAAVPITAGQGADADLDLSGDGRRLVFSSYHVNLNIAEISLSGTSAGRIQWLTHDAARGESAPCYSHDGRKIAYFSTRFGAEREGIWIMDADGSNATHLVDDDTINVFPRWSGDDRELVFASRTPLDVTHYFLRSVPAGGGAPQRLPVPIDDSQWGDVALDGRFIVRTSRTSGEIVDPRSGRRQPVDSLFGEPRWSPDGDAYAYVVRPDARRLDTMGLWVAPSGGTRHRIFSGWVAGFAWASAHDCLVVEGSADLSGTLWRVRDSGQREQVMRGISLYRSGGIDPVLTTFLRFDPSPDGVRIVIEALDGFEADIGLIENVR
jgi:eukaryotic-like serine/threonine-protein kinase